MGHVKLLLPSPLVPPGFPPPSPLGSKNSILSGTDPNARQGYPVCKTSVDVKEKSMNGGALFSSFPQSRAPNNILEVKLPKKSRKKCRHDQCTGIRERRQQKESAAQV